MEQTVVLGEIIENWRTSTEFHKINTKVEIKQIS